jgi:hypothetical protein
MIHVPLGATGPAWKGSKTKRVAGRVRLSATPRQALRRVLTRSGTCLGPAITPRNREKPGDRRRDGGVHPRHDIQQVRALLGHAQLETKQVHARIQPKALKEAVGFDETRALEVLS